jgi:hypothetical protein
MTRFRPILLVLAALAFVATAASAQTPVGRFRVSFMPTDSAATKRPPTALRFDDAIAPLPRARSVLAPLPASDAQAPPHVAFEYGDAYELRARIHRIASFATLPLFATEAIVGQSLYTSPTPGKKTAHLVVADAIAGLFAVNSVTGVWNLLEARHDPEGRGRRLVHGILMLAADAGFLATAMLGPEHEHGRAGAFERSPSTHRAVAFASLGTASIGYALMLFGGH